jgi:hypothetical protein
MEAYNTLDRTCFEDQLLQINYLYSFKPQSPLIQKVSKVASLVEGIKVSSSERMLEAYRTQEHLIRGTGSWYGVHATYFKETLPKILPDSFLLNELNNGILKASHLLKRKLPKGDKYWGEKVEKKLIDLEEYESLLIDCTTITGMHSMMMRITKKTLGNFELHFANTGLGIVENQDFHPLVKNFKGVEVPQIVAHIVKISKDKLLGCDFFRNFARVSEGMAPLTCLDSPNNTSESDDGEQKGGSKIINGMYNMLRSLDGKIIAESDDRYLGMAQVSNSCAATSLLALFKSAETRRAIKHLNIFLKLESLLYHYKEIKMGSGNSYTRKVMVLDLIQSLKPEFDREPLRYLCRIETELKEDLEFTYIKNDNRDIELMVPYKNRKNIEDYIKTEGEELQLSGFNVKLKQRLDYLGEKHIATSLYTKLKIKNNKNVSFNVEKVKEGEYKGKELSDKIGVLCFHIANSNYELSQISLLDFCEKFNEGELSSTKHNHEISIKNYETFKIISSLSIQWKCDHTRSGIAKQHCLNTIAANFLIKKILKIDCPCLDIKDKNSQETLIQYIKKSISGEEFDVYYLDDVNRFLDHVEETSLLYQNLNVSNYLQRDNIWIETTENLIDPDARKPVYYVHPEIKHKVYDTEKSLQELLKEWRQMLEKERV